MRGKTRTWLGRVAAALVLAGALATIPYQLYVRSGLARTLVLRRQLETLRATDADLRVENARMAREAESLRGDMRAIERVARRELGWLRPGEVIFQLEHAPAAPARAADPVARHDAVPASIARPLP